jgi:putative DNA primase/helicase
MNSKQDLAEAIRRNPGSVRQLNEILKKHGLKLNGDKQPPPAQLKVEKVDAAAYTTPATSEMPEPPPHVYSSAEAGPAAKDWPLPQPLGGELTAVPAFDLKMLPEALRPLTEDVSYRMQVPPEVPAVVTLVALGAAIGRRAYIQPKQLDSTWRVFAHIWAIVIMLSGFLKSPTMAAILAPVRQIEEQWWQEYKAAMPVYQRQKERADLRINAWKQQVQDAYKKGKPEPPRPDDPPLEPVYRRMIVNEYTKEKLHLILSENPGGVLSFRDELAGLLAQLDELGHAGDREFLMELWNVQRYTRDTISRGTQHADSGISMLGGMTPQSLHWYLADAAKKHRLDDGLMQRFQLSIQPDQQDRDYVDKLPDYRAMEQAKTTYERLLALDPAQPLQVRFDQEAQQLFKQWLRELEVKLRGDGTLHPAFKSHLSKYRSLMPALALEFELADNTSQTTVSLLHAQQAAEWCSYLEAHARRIYSPAISAVRQAAAEIGRHLMAGWKREEGAFTLREVNRNQWSGCDTAETNREALEILSDANWVRPVPAKNNGRPSEKYLINPRLKEVAPCPANG